MRNEASLPGKSLSYACVVTGRTAETFAEYDGAEDHMTFGFEFPNGKKVGFINIEGNIVVPVIYDDADKEFSKGYARVKKRWTLELCQL